MSSLLPSVNKHRNWYHKLILLFLFLGVGVFIWGIFHYHESPPSKGGSEEFSHLSNAIVDTLSIGDKNSEQQHALKADGSQRFSGGLEEPALKLLPSGTQAWASMPMEFSMKVDPEKQNYITGRFWGSDKGEELGRLIVTVDGKQLGYTGAGDYSALNQTDEEGEAPGRFFYETLPLPPALTKGKSSLQIKVVAYGPRWVYGDSFEKFQKPFSKESRGIYGFYTHADACFLPPASEKQGKFPEAPVRPSPGAEVLDQARDFVNRWLTKTLGETFKPVPKSSYEDQLLPLAEAYNTSWTAVCHDPRVIDRIVQIGDLEAAEFAQNPKVSEITVRWVGYGPLGEAILKTWPELSKRMDDKISIGGVETIRRDAWARILRASLDYWRTHRRSYTNQSMIVDWNIYTANRALALLSPSLALPEAQGLHYLYQSIGVEPWVGSDPGEENSGEKDVPMENIHAPYGDNYSLITRKGLSRELGFVAGYGETILRFVHDMAELTGDKKIREQLAKIDHARMNFRYPALDADGYRCMKLTSEIDERGEHFPISGSAYAENFASRENWGMGLAALLSDDPKIVGATQQCLDDNQYFSVLASRLKKGGDPLGFMHTIGDYARVKSLPLSTSRLPMSKGQPDFVFSDEEDAVIAIKHGETRLFVNLYFRAENGVNRAARILEITPRMTKIATVRTEVEVERSGKDFIRPDHLQNIRNGGEKLNPPGEQGHQAWAGEVLPMAKRPDDASQPKYGNWGPFLGKASFYWLRYDNYLIGLNTTEHQTFTLPAPPDAATAKDLVSGKEMSLRDGVKVPPLTTVVFYLGQH
jgi:hypothetical protein